MFICVYTYGVHEYMFNDFTMISNASAITIFASEMYTEIHVVTVASEPKYILR